MMELQYTLFEVDNHVARITINRPEALNALNPGVSYELSQHFDEVESNDDIWLAVVTGVGDRAFSAGADLKHRALMQTMSKEERDESNRMSREARGLFVRWHFPKPLIARVNGYAMGGGLELALACDIIVIADHAEIGLPEPRRGLVAGAGGVHRLPRQVGLKVAMGYLLTGRHMSAQRAYELGLVNQVVPLAELDNAVDEWVADIVRCAPLSVRATKEMTMRGLDSPLSEAFTRSYEWEEKRRVAEDTLEGPLAFAEKRDPVWKGR